MNVYATIANTKSKLIFERSQLFMNTVRPSIYDRYKNVSTDDWEKAIQKAAQQKDPTFPHFSHIPKLGSGDLQSGLKEAFRFYRIAKNHLDDSSFGNDKVYLDFGCGVGRILRLFMHDFKPEKMIGLDVNEELIDIARGDFTDTGVQFNQIQTRPPVDLPDASVDVITAYSVFSHFSCIQATRWLNEFRRIARPGATLILTTYGRGHLTYLNDTLTEALPRGHQKQKNVIAAEAGGIAELLRIFKLGEMFYLLANNKFGVYDYGWAYVGEEFVRRVWGQYFDIIDVIDDYSRLEQMIVIMRKP